MRKLVAFFLFFFVSKNVYAIRAIMEQTNVSRDTIFIDTTNVRFGISTSSPLFKVDIEGGGQVVITSATVEIGTNTNISNSSFDVSGVASFGQGANKSTFSATGALSLSSALTASNGGTGLQTLTAHGVVIGEGTSAAYTTPAMANGGLIIGAGTGTDPSTGTLTGTNNEVTVTNGAGTITLATAGQTVTCIAGQYLGAATYTGGVASGGACTTAGSGVGDVLAKSTQTFSGGNTFQSSTTFNGAVFYSTISVSGNYSVLKSDIFITCNAASGAISVTLPPLSANIGRVLEVKKTDSSNNSCTITAAGADTIDGQATKQWSSQYTSISIWGGQDEWHIF